MLSLIFSPFSFVQGESVGGIASKYIMRSSAVREMIFFIRGCSSGIKYPHGM